MIKSLLLGKVHRPFVKFYPGFPLLSLFDELYEVEDLLYFFRRKGL